jgi:hypothetical protein
MAEYVNGHELGTYSIKVMGECLAPRIVNRLLFPGEKIAYVLQGLRDVTVFTDQRILLVNYRSISGKSVEYTSYAYRDIISYSITTPGLGFDVDGEIVLRFINREVLIISIDKGNNMDRFLFLTYDLVSAGKMNIPLQKGVFPDGEDVRTNNEKFFD